MIVWLSLTKRFGQLTVIFYPFRTTLGSFPYYVNQVNGRLKDFIFSVRITLGDFPLKVITQLVFLIGVGLMRQGLVKQVTDAVN